MAAFSYSYKTGYSSKVSADVAGPICQRMHEANTLTPENLVNEARPESSPIHSAFEWNNTVAAEKWRQEQARQMIKSIIWVESDIQTERHLKLVTTQETEYSEEMNISGERAFVSTGEFNHRYVPIAVAVTNDKWRENLLKAAKRDMIAFVAKYRRLKELTNIIKDMNDFLGA